MHRALQINEVLTMILRSYGDCCQQRTMSAILAATCRTFSEPASDVLWEALPRLEPLLRCIPDEEFARPAPSQGWRRFLKHAARVKSLVIDGVDADEVNERLPTLLTLRSRSEVGILPNLRKLAVRHSFLGLEPAEEPSPHDLHFFLFLGHKLESVRLQTCDEDSFHLVYQLAISCPRLRYLDVPQFPKGAARIIRCFSALEELDCDEPPIDVDVLEGLAYLPSLRRLSVTLPYDFRGVGTRATRDKMFPALQKLEVGNVQDLRHLLYLLRSIRSPDLHELSVYLSSCHADESSGTIHQTFNMLTKFPKLRRLTIRGFSATIDTPFPPRAILCLHHLEEICFEVGGLTMASQRLADLARGCPKLRRFTAYSSDQPGWPLEVLESFAEHFPELEYLHTRLDTCNAPTVGPPSACTLTPVCLRLEESPLKEEHWEQVAGYISLIYPHASFKFDPLWDEEDLRDTDKNALRWRQVARVVARASSAGA
ncbi:hypothetical protein PsYK624_138550 [Phanerochaete sordida]|uniref:F-box domain-containing protein n=1 Tax=Phanerochaete sordida TaxID=48140 RepID=A0A9P3GNT9_9APHY|nr:hypothetical protein PsYK624_138550 [Phanerochaete sordida]